MLPSWSRPGPDGPSSARSTSKDDAEIVSDADEAARASAALDQKYAAFGMPRAEVPDATKQHYRAPAVIRIIPDGKVLTWDNARVRLRKER